MFKKINYGCYKLEIRGLLKRRLDLKDRILYHGRKIKHHENRIKQIDGDKLVIVEEQLNYYLEQAGNKTE